MQAGRGAIVKKSSDVYSEALELMYQGRYKEASELFDLVAHFVNTAEKHHCPVWIRSSCYFESAQCLHFLVPGLDEKQGMQAARDGLQRLNCALEVIKEAEDMGELWPEKDDAKAEILLLQGSFLIDLSDFEKAKEKFHGAEEILGKDEPKVLLGWSKLYSTRSSPSDAIKCLERAASLLRLEKYNHRKTLLPVVLSDLSISFIMVENYAEALKCRLQAIELDEQQDGLSIDMCDSCYSAACIFIKLNNPLKAKEFMLKSLDFARQAIAAKQHVGDYLEHCEGALTVVRRMMVDKKYRKMFCGKEMRACGLCFCVGNLQKCGNCCEVYYCCREHQVEDWKHHKPACKKIPENRACILCHKGDSALSCPDCKQVFYCSAECKKKDGKQHARLCHAWKSGQISSIEADINQSSLSIKGAGKRN